MAATTDSIAGDCQEVPESSIHELELARVPRVSRDGVAIVRAQRIEWANRALGGLFGRDPDDLIGLRLAELHIEDLDTGVPIALGGLFDDGWSSLVGNVAPPGAATIPVSVDAVRLDPGVGGRWVLTFRSVGRLIRADEDLRASEERFRALAANAPIGVFQSDHGLRLGYLNPKFAEIWGRDAEALRGTAWMDGIHEDDRGEVVAALARTLAGEESATTFRVEASATELRLVHARMVPVTRSDRSIGFVGSLEDVTEARNHEDELRWQATHDPLTALANRVELLRQMADALHGGRQFAVLYFDLDDFKVVNDSLGHGAGDALLCSVAERLCMAVRPSDTPARLGGDEFVVLCRDVYDADVAMGLARRLLDELDHPVVVGNRKIRVTASVGVVLGRSGRAESLLRDADVAMYQAKQAGKARVAMFDERARLRMQQHLDIMSGLHQSLLDDDIGVAYQPVVSATTRRIVGAEALLRYEHPTAGAIPALDVVRLAESSGCIAELGANVLATACRDLARWRHDRGALAPDYMAVNLAAAQLDERDLVSDIVDVLDHFRLGPSDLCIELTESQLMVDADHAKDVLTDLHERGVRIAIDDFGTGYSSLAYLRSFPADVVKLDRSFIADVGHEPATAAIVRAVVTLSETFGFAVTAEGVETAEQLRAVSALGCDLLQGYALGRPTPYRDFPLETAWP